MKLAIGCDHRGVQLKDALAAYLRKQGHEVEDVGTYSSESVNYPIYGEKVGRSVASGKSELGIVICGTGFGISLAASAVGGVRAACCSDIYTATLTRRHNNANVLAMGAEIVGEGLACMIADAFISAKFEGGRHIGRLAMLKDIRRRNAHVTGKSITVHAFDRALTLYNQRCTEWTYPYEYAPEPGGTLKNSGCGVFSLCQAIEFMSGKQVSPEEIADFSVKVGGRGDDGTDRPALLKGVVEADLDKEYGFEYRLDGHQNNHELLWDCLSRGGAALCNLRKGHIVTLIGCRVSDGEKQVLAMDCHSESADDRVADSVREVLPESKITWAVTNASGLVTGRSSAFGLFWVPLTQAMDFDLLHKR